MPLYKFTGDRFLPVLAEPHVEVSFADWRRNPQDHAEATALRISNDTPVGDVADDLAGFSTIILDFPQFRDGRAYSQARLLRERYGYAGEIRARGQVLRDQVLFMVRCGVDVFEIASENVAGLNAALKEFSFAYQSGADGAAPVWRRRLARAAAA